MKTVKHFFDNHNRLNKGYFSNNHYSKENKNFSNFSSVLPPLDLIQEYEDIYPGSFEKIVKLAEKEQDHKHKIEIENFKIEQQKLKFAKNIAYTTTWILCLTCILVSFFSYNNFVLVATVLSVLLIAWSTIKGNVKTFHFRDPNNFRNNSKFNKFNKKSGRRYK